MRTKNIRNIVLVSLVFFSIWIVLTLKDLQADYYAETIVPQIYNKKPSFLFDYKTLDKYNQYCKNTKKRIFCQSFIYQKFFADLMRISRIQYIWKSAQRQEILYFTEIINFITALTPRKVYPYTFAQLIWPISKNAKVDESVKKQSWIDTVTLWKKGIAYVCNGDNCPNYDLPNHLAFNYFYYLKANTEAEKYYKLATNQEDAPEITKQMPAIVAWSLNNHLKSMNLWFAKLPVNIDFKNEFQMKEYEKNIKKSVFELSLYLIQQSSEKALKSWNCVQEIKCLKDKFYLKNEVLKNIDICKNISKSKSDLVESWTWSWISNQILCQVLYLWFQNNWIQMDGTLIYPFNDWENDFEYKWHPIAERRWIMSK